MNIINMPFDAIEFKDVVECCDAGTIESVVLDYKKSLPKDLAKHFATFSNTLGGLIIIGVEEDTATGLPKNYDGIVYASKLIDTIHQFAANVTPYPSYKVKATNEVNGKVFIIIKILKGDQPPYLLNKDASVWLRTGNVSTPLRNPDAKELDIMHDLKNRSAKARDKLFEYSKEVYSGAFERGEKERAAAKAEGKQVDETKLGENAALLSTDIMPNCPDADIMDYKDLIRKQQDYRVLNSNFGTFPDHNLETIPKGVSFFKWGYNSGFSFGIITASGYIGSKRDVLQYRKDTKRGDIYISHILGEICLQLLSAKSIYNMAGYNGLLFYSLKLNDIKRRYIQNMPVEGQWAFNTDGNQIDKISDYEWLIEDLDTFKLNDNSSLIAVIEELIERICWALGVNQLPSGMIAKKVTELGFK